MRLPTEEESIAWAKKEARQIPENPTQVRKYLLVLLSIIKTMENKIFNSERKALKRG